MGFLGKENGKGRAAEARTQGYPRGRRASLLGALTVRANSLRMIVVVVVVVVAVAVAVAVVAVVVEHYYF